MSPLKHWILGAACALAGAAAPHAHAQSVATWPTDPPATICADQPWLHGPATPPEGAVVLLPGDHSGMNWNQPGKTFWFANGQHTLGNDPLGQIIPGNDTTFTGEPGAVLDGQNRNLSAFTQHATGVRIEYLEITGFGRGQDNNDQGVVNHDAGVNWVIRRNYIHDNDGAGVFLGSGSRVTENCLKNNGQYGFSAYHPDGVTDVLLDRNEITGNNQDDWERLRPYCGCTGGGKFWNTHGAVVTNNWVHGNFGTGLWADFNNSQFRFEGNYIEDNDGVGLFYEISYNFMIERNTFKRNALVQGKRKADANDPFPMGAIYISESGGDTRAGAIYTQSTIAQNYFQDNWDGVVLWENADRFCRPGEENDTTNNCPFFDRTWGTRFKTQNVAVRDNEFHFDRTAIGCTNALCGRMAVFSNYGSWPTTSPYLGTVIQQAITFAQNNTWSNNAYHGNWRYTPYDMGRNVSFTVWRGAPYAQDAGSTFDGEEGGPSTPPPGSGPGTPPAGSATNFLDADTSTLEGSAGRWSAWYSATATASGETAHGGTKSLRIDVTDPWGWGVELSNYPGFAATAGTKRISAWARLGAGTNVAPTLTVKWLDANGATLQTDPLPLPALTTTWTQAAKLVDAPYGTATVLVFVQGGDAAGTTLYLDDVVVGDAPNALDADTAGLEASIGVWTSWYAATIARSTDAAYSGANGLAIDATGGAWGVEIAPWPGFATTAGNKRVAFHGRRSAGTAASAKLQVKWFGTAPVQADVITLNLTNDWQLATADLVAPAGTTDVRVELVGSAAAGDRIFIDDVVITDLP